MLKTVYSRCFKFGKYFIPLNLFLIIIYGCEMIIPYIFSNFIDTITYSDSIHVINKPIIIISSATILLLVASYFKGILSELTRSKVCNDYLNEIDSKLEHMPLSETKKYNPAYLNTRIFNDIFTTVGFAIDNLIVAIIMFISTIILFYMIASINIWMLSIVFAALIINIAGILVLNKLVYKRGYEYRDQNNVYLSENNDRLASIKETKIHSWYDISGKQVNTAFDKLFKKGISLNKVIAIINNIGNLTKNFTLILTIIVGGRLLIDSSITIGQLILITTYTNMCLTNSEFFLKLGQGFQHAKISHSRLEEFAKAEDENNGTKVLDEINAVEIKDLSFAYPEMQPLYSNLNLKFDKGRIYCLKGRNGDGKTTLIDLMLGLYYDYDGEICFNDIEISQLDMRHMRKEKISVILQESNMQRISVKDNLLKGLGAYSEKMMGSLSSKFNMDKHIDEMDAQFLSGGEKQKISVIRGMMKKSDLLILDEPVSAMDAAGIKILKDELIKIKSDKIIVFISHNEELFDIVDEFVDLEFCK